MPKWRPGLRLQRGGQGVDRGCPPEPEDDGHATFPQIHHSGHAGVGELLYSSALASQNSAAEECAINEYVSPKNIRSIKKMHIFHKTC